MFPTATKFRNSSSIKCRSLVWSLENQTCSQEVWSYWFPPLCQTLSVPPAPCQSTSLHTKQERKPGVKTNLSTPLDPWLELHRVNRGQDTTVRLISPHLQELVCLFKSAPKKIQHPYKTFQWSHIATCSNLSKNQQFLVLTDGHIQLQTQFISAWWHFRQCWSTVSSPGTPPGVVCSQLTPVKSCAWSTWLWTIVPSKILCKQNKEFSS